MSKSNSYPEEVFEQRLKRYKLKRRSLLPHQVEMSTCMRVNSRVISSGAYPTDFLYGGREPGTEAEQLPHDLFDFHIQRDDITNRAFMSGRSGSVFWAETCCIVDVVRFLLDALHKESCGECSACRIGTLRMLEVLNRICAGAGTPSDIDVLEDLAVQAASASMCQVGKSAAAVVSDSLHLFRSQYTEHVLEHRCPSNTCNIPGAKNGQH
jgi:NADH:ubiquinone oxidoreductase subunit F (NADH-binding)